jgi:hypothetical protein
MRNVLALAILIALSVYAVSLYASGLRDALAERPAAQPPVSVADAIREAKRCAVVSCQTP